jgi:hypothetical protein
MSGKEVRAQEETGNKREKPVTDDTRRVLECFSLLQAAIERARLGPGPVSPRPSPGPAAVATAAQPAPIPSPLPAPEEAATAPEPPVPRTDPAIEAVLAEATESAAKLPVNWREATAQLCNDVRRTGTIEYALMIRNCVAEFCRRYQPLARYASTQHAGD